MHIPQSELVIAITHLTCLQLNEALHTQKLFYKAAFWPPYAPSHPSPAPQIWLANCRHCALYKFIYLLTYLHTPEHNDEIKTKILYQTTLSSAAT